MRNVYVIRYKLECRFENDEAVNRVSFHVVYLIASDVKDMWNQFYLYVHRLVDPKEWRVEMIDFDVQCREDEWCL